MTAKKFFSKKKAVSAPDEKTFRPLFENHPIPMWIYDLKTLAFLEVNDAAMEKYGYSRGEFLALTLKDIRPVEDVTRLLDHLEEERPSLQHSGEWRHRLKNGRVIDVEITSHTLGFEGHAAVLVMAQDITQRRQAENILRQSEERYHLLFDRMADGLYRSTHEGKFVDVNPAMVRMFGYASREEMLGVDIKKDLYFSPEERGSHVLDTGQEETETYRMRRKDGSEIWVEDHGLYVHDEYGNIIFHEGMLRDVTGRKQAAEALRENESLLKESQIIANIGSYTLDFSTGMWKSSEVLDKLFGIDDSYIRSVEGWVDLIHPDHRQQMSEYFTNEVIGRHIRFDREYKIVRKNDQAERWMHGLGELKFDAQNNISKMHGTIQDITERKRAEQALQESEALYRQAIEVAGAVPYYESYYDNGRRIKYDFIGEGIRKITGYGPEEFTAALWDKLVLDVHLVEDLEGYSLDDAIQMVRSGEISIWKCEHRIRARNGEIRWIFEAAVELRDEHGVSHGSIGMYQDITERKQAEEAINQRLAEQDILHQASQSLLSVHLDPEAIYATLHRAVAQIMPCDAFNIVLEDENGGDYHAVYLYDTGKRYPALRIPRGGGLSGKVISNGETLFIHDNLQENVPAVHFGTSISVRSILAVPLRKNNKSVGMVSAQSYQPNVYVERHRVLLETLAAQIATVIENARLFEAERKQRQMSDALRDALSAGASMSASLDFETVLDSLLEALERVVPFEGGSIMFLQPGNQKSGIARMRGYKKLDAETVKKIAKHSFEIANVENLRRMFDIKQPLVIPDVKQYPGWIRNPETDFIRSWAGAPIIVNDEIIAFFSLDSSKPNFFTSDHVELMRAFTGQASLALQNARLFDETARRAEEFASLYETSNALSAENDLNTLLKNIVEHAVTLLNATNGFMYLYDPANESLEVVVSTTPAISTGTILHLGEGAAGQVAQSHQPIRIDDYSIWDGRSHQYDEILIRAVLDVPMLFRGGLIGVLNVAEMSDSNRVYTEVDERLLSLFAAQAAGVLHSASLREETARRAREFAALYETSNALSAENELNSMLQVIVEHAKKLLGSASSGMYLYLSETNELELTVDTTHYTPIGTRLKLGEGVAGRVAQTHQPMRVDDYSTWEGRSALYLGASIRAVLEVPMMYGGELIGVLTADEVGDSVRKFTEADERLLSLFASQAAGAIHSARLREQTARRLDQLQALHTIDRAISSSFDLRPILNTVISQTIAQLEVDAADVLLFHPQLQTLEYVAGHGFRTRAIEQTQLRLGEDHAGRAAFGRRTIHVPDLPESGSNFVRAALLAGEGFLEYYGVPLIAKGEIKGVLEVFHRTPLPFNPEWENFLETLAGQAAITIDQTQLFDDLQRANLELIIAYNATIEGWSHAMDLRDKETEGHTLRVTEMTLALAKVMGIGEKEMLHIRRGALLHDIGKMGIPDNILLKVGKLTDEEWAVMREHPTFAYNMLQPIKYLRQSLDIPYCHHEKWDGTGYPRGLRGDQIPLVARIFAVVDVWDAVTIDRPYRKAWTKQKALKHIREQSGKHFEPKVVEAFLKLFDTKTSGSSRISTASNKSSQQSTKK